MCGTAKPDNLETQPFIGMLKDIPPEIIMLDDELLGLILFADSHLA